MRGRFAARMNSGVRPVHKHFDDLARKCDQDEVLRSEDLDELCSLTGLNRDDLFDSLADYIARRFASNDLSFETSGAVMNFLWAESLFGLSGFAKDVFLAFDDGEHLPSGASPDTDPVGKYTRPQIAGLIARRAQV